MTWTLEVLLGVEGCRKQNGPGLVSLPLAVEHQPPAPIPSQTTALVPGALVSKLWNEEARPGPLPQLSCLGALPLHAPNCSPCPGQLVPVCCVDSWFSRPVGISKTNEMEMEASAKPAWGQQGLWLISKSYRAWHPLCFLSQGPARLPSTAGHWREV